MRFAPLFVGVLIALPVVQHAQAQLPTLTEVDRELITAVFRQQYTELGKSYDDGAKLALASETLVSCGEWSSPGCRDRRELIGSGLTFAKVPARDELLAAFATRNRSSWQVGLLTMEFATSTPLQGSDTVRVLGTVTISTLQKPNLAALDNRLGGRALIRVSAPAFTDDGRWALLYVDSELLCGSGDAQATHETVYVAERIGPSWEVRHPGRVIIGDGICPLPQPVIR